MLRSVVVGFLSAFWLSGTTTSAFIPEAPYRASTAVWCAKEEQGESVIPVEVTTKSLRQIYPAMIEHKAKYGNPNIPLGTTEGRQCNLLRRMQIQGKLTDDEVKHLKELGFIFHALEDVYKQLDFDEMVPRLLAAKKEYGSLDIPKKYPQDPELGAYVTGVRRLGKDRVDPEHVVRLDGIAFVWICEFPLQSICDWSVCGDCDSQSPHLIAYSSSASRKCGSKFMNQYRDIQLRLQDGENETEVFKDPEVIKFVRAQKEAHRKETLSETRVEYMTRVFGNEWWK